MKKLWILIVVLIAAVVVLGVLLMGRRIDVEAARAALLEADAEWSKAAAAKDVERYLSFLTDDAAVLPPNAPILTGKDAIRKGNVELSAAPGLAISWQPSQAEVSRAGDLGYTRGSAELTMNDPKGNPVTDRLKYVTVWKKQPDGTWKVVADIFNSDLPLPAIGTWPTPEKPGTKK